MSTAKGPPPSDFDENPPWSQEDFDRARREPVPEEVLAPFRNRGRPRKAEPKVPVTIRLDADVVGRLRGTGAGWQTRVNDILRRHLDKGAA